MSAAIAATCIGATPTFAQEQAAGGLEEIVVTARKREESLQDAPLTMQAFSRERLEKFDLTSIERLQAATPNLYVARVSNGSGAQITMRGIGASSATSIGIEQSVSVILNGAYYGQGRVLNEGMFDLAQVEVLKGPQTLFYGKNATAGVISLRTARPTDEFEGTLRAGYEFETEQTRIEGILSGPISDNWSYRAALRWSDMNDGYYSNNAVDKTYTYLDPTFTPVLTEVVPGDTRNMPQEEEVIARLALAYDNDSSLSALLTAQYTDVEILNSAYNNIPFECNNGFFPAGQNGSGFECGDNFAVAHNRMPATLAAEMPFARSNGDLYNEYDSYSINLELDYQLTDNLALNSVTNIQENENNWALPGDFANVDNGIFATEHATWEAWSEELRLNSQFDGPFNFMLGLYYQETERDFNQWVTFGFASFNDAAPPGLEYTTYNKQSVTDGETMSAYFELVYDITDTVTISGGARYVDETKDSFFEQPYVHPSGQGALGWAEGRLEADQSFDEVTPELTVSWQATDNVNLYAAYKTAYKSGGFSNGAVLSFENQNSVSDFTFEPETGEGFEVGVKSTLMDNQLRLNASVYQYTYEDLQLDYFDSAAIVFITLNAGEATSEGVEVDFEYAPYALPGLVVRGLVAYNQAEYDDFIAPCWEGQTVETGCNAELPGIAASKPGQDISGQPTGMAPEWSGSLGFTYDGELANGMGWGVAFDALYSDDYTASALGNPFAGRDSFIMTNAAVYLRGVDDRWELKLMGKNLGNEVVVNGVLESAGSRNPAGGPGTHADLIGFAGVPKTIQAQLTYNF
ncbi:TonB-dependent receptor [Luminiphilus syltensis NOR5-1B]|uniref:TonB-dependent receptor n=1 Tax=Luminiphilus syltensis NOR5-1B TaxID=565045 RepID=B8KUX1_9GAMM|nr:TonB-dependent receptor [Luminiphilus syltensis NOR5-1B]